MIINLLAWFAGIRNEIFSFGTEASYKTNLDLTHKHYVWGLSTLMILQKNH